MSFIVCINPHAYFSRVTCYWDIPRFIPDFNLRGVIYYADHIVINSSRILPISYKLLVIFQMQRSIIHTFRIKFHIIDSVFKIFNHDGWRSIICCVDIIILTKACIKPSS
ncbi:hypothetical protein D3C78_1044780 [compost metagenome]